MTKKMKHKKNNRGEKRWQKKQEDDKEGWKWQRKYLEKE